MKLTVITIAYNSSQVIGQTIESVLNQEQGETPCAIEYLIIDGASSDDTVAIAESYIPAMADKGIDYRISSEPDKGIYDAMNKGLRMARGKYILYLNAGDTFHSPEILSLYADATVNDPDIIYADTVIVDSSRRILGPRHLSAPDRLTRSSFAAGMLICHQAFMMKRSLAPEYDTRYRFSADYDWTVRCIAASSPDRCVNLKTVAIDYLADGTTDRNHIRSLRERLQIMCRHYGTLPTLLRHISFAARALKRKMK